MKKIIIFSIAFFSFLSNYAQNANKSEDQGKITLGLYVPEQTDKMPNAAHNALTNKLSQIIANDGTLGASANQRFIITASITTLSKDLTSTAPPMTALSLEVNLYIGDGIEGTKFASTSLSVKGVGENETKAYIAAIRNINTMNPAIKSFLQSGKAKVIDYYNRKCDFIIKDAQTLAGQNKFEEALFKLTSVPDACKDCYSKAINSVGSIYKKQIDKDCQVKLAESKNIWLAKQDMDGANSAVKILSQIDPQASCFNEVKILVNQIAKKVNELDKREWSFKLKEQQQNGDMIKAARDIGVAYGEHQPQSVSYNVIGW